MTFAKKRGVAIILVGHVTKDGQIAGPRVVEHMVDTVLYFEGERGHHFRILRAVKNRFGPADEIGVFEMTGDGLAQVTNPSALFLSDRDKPAPGSAVFAGIEGTRPVLTEIQALVSPSTAWHAAPHGCRAGFRVGCRRFLRCWRRAAASPLPGLMCYLNVAGGMRVSEPAADLAVAAALLSAREDVAIPPDMVLFGEISLSGALTSRRTDRKSVERSDETWFHTGNRAIPVKTGRGRWDGSAPDARSDGVCRRNVRGGLTPQRRRTVLGAMEGFTLIDGVVALVIVLSAVLAYSRGLGARSAGDCRLDRGCGAGLCLCRAGAALVKELPVVGNFLADSCELSIIAAFAAVFAIGLVIAALFSPLLSSHGATLGSGRVDQGLGFLFGVVRGVLAGRGCLYRL